MSKIPLAPVPMYRTANNLDEAMSEIQAHTYPYDPNTIRSLVMMYHNTLIKEMLASLPKYPCSVGVGDGTGNLFVHGEYDAIKRVQDLIFENERLKP